MRRPAAIATLAILVLTVAQLAIATFAGLDQFAGKGFGYRLAVYPLLMLVVPAIWWWRSRHTALLPAGVPGPGREINTAPPWGAFALIMAPFLIDVTGNSLDLYDSVAWWDDANHLVNWALLSGGLGLLVARTNTNSRAMLVLIITGIGAILAIGWELGEYWTFIRRGVELDTAYTDMLGDEAVGTLGALIAGVVVAATRRKPSPNAR